jgi:hypothetical protein
MQDLGGRKPEEVRGATPSKRPAPRWCPRGITKTRKRRLQKMRQMELAKKKEEEERDIDYRLKPDLDCINREPRTSSRRSLEG